LTGKKVDRFDTNLALIARVNDDTPVRGRVVEKVESRGKWCLLFFSGDLILVTHMLMSGSWHIYRTGERWWMGRDRMRVAIGVEGFEAVAFNVPIVEFHTARSLERSSQVPKLGPDLLSDEFTLEGGIARLEGYGTENPEAEVGVTLLNQRVIAGLGNVYKSEVAFAAGVNPFRQLSTVTAREREQMVSFSQRWMKANVVDGASDGIVTYAGNRRTTHSSNREDRLWVYGRQGKECRRCGALVMMRKQGEQARSTYWCPACQPWLPAEGQGATAPVGGEFGSRRRKVGC